MCVREREREKERESVCVCVRECVGVEGTNCNGMAYPVPRLQV